MPVSCSVPESSLTAILQQFDRTEHENYRFFPITIFINGYITFLYLLCSRRNVLIFYDFINNLSFVNYRVYIYLFYNVQRKRREILMCCGLTFVPLLDHAYYGKRAA